MCQDLPRFQQLMNLMKAQIATLPHEAPLWKIINLEHIKNLDYQINFAEDNIYSLYNEEVHKSEDQKFNTKAHSLALKFSQAFS